MIVSEPQPPIPVELQEEAQDWLLRLTSGQATEADAVAFRQWCERSPQHARAFSQARRLWQTLAPAARQVRQQASIGVSSSPGRPIPEPARRLTRRAFVGGAIAASLAVVLVRPTWSGLGGLMADYQTEVGEQRSIALASGVTLELNTQTRINRRPFDGGDGLELLDGEVEVLARTSGPVRIFAGSGWLTASEAQFNVRSSESGVCVTCLQGHLLLEYRGRQIPLEDAQQLTYDDLGHGQPVAVDPARVMAWRRRILIFDGQPLAEVIEEINRYRPGVIMLMNKALGQRKVQARFSLDQLSEVTELIRTAYGARVTELPGGVVLVS